MRAILLAAGMGTRLRPLTLETPKSLIEDFPLIKTVASIFFKDNPCIRWQISPAVFKGTNAGRIGIMVCPISVAMRNPSPLEPVWLKEAPPVARMTC